MVICMCYKTVLSLYFPEDIVKYVIMKYIEKDIKQIRAIKLNVIYQLSYTVYSGSYLQSLVYFRKLRRLNLVFPELALGELFILDTVLF